MFWQIVIFVILIVAGHLSSAMFAVKELGKGEDTAKLAQGLAQTVLGFFVFMIIGEDEVLLEWRDGDLAVLYYLGRYAFLLDALYGSIQALAVVLRKIESVKGVAVERELDASSVKASASGSISQRSYDAQTTGAPTGHIPAWKRVEMEEAKSPSAGTEQ